MKAALAIVLSVSAPLAASAQSLPDGMTTKDVRFVSEGVQCYGKLFLPKGFTAESKALAVVLAPGWAETETAIEKYAARFASKGLVAMAIDYRGWGRSGAYVYPGDPVRWDDRLRFSQHTAKVRLRRRRLIPQDQVLDIRNAVAYLQGEPGVDPARIGVWGTDMGGGHVIVAAAHDVRVKAGVAQTPIVEGRDVSRRTAAPSASVQQVEIRLARTGQAPATPAAAAEMSETETKIALAEYHPFWSLDQIPQTCAVLFIVAEKDMTVDNEVHGVEASKKLKGPTGVTVIPGATHAMAGARAFEAAADAAAAWFLKYL